MFGGKSMKKRGSRKHMSKKHHKGGRKHAKKTMRRHKKHHKGGMVAGLEAMLKTALVPLGLYVAQKKVQRSRK